MISLVASVLLIVFIVLFFAPLLLGMWLFMFDMMFETHAGLALAEFARKSWSNLRKKKQSKECGCGKSQCK